MNFNFLFTISIYLLICKIIASDSEKRLVPIKIIEEPIQYINIHSSSRMNDPDDETELKPKYKPADFSGPSFFKELDGQCFDLLNKNYKWVVCPFQNVTQYEQNLRWNPFKGIIGIWHEWEIIDGKFSSLLMLNGDDCGKEGSRQAKVFFVCGEKNQISEIMEPSVCKYEIKFKTPLACEQNFNIFTMNVYPYLNESLKLEWNVVYSDYKNNLITDKMYNLSLNNIYQEAGFKRKPDESKMLKIETNENEEPEIENASTKKIKFLTFDELFLKYEACQKELKRLKSNLNNNSTVENSTKTIQN